MRFWVISQFARLRIASTWITLSFMDQNLCRRLMPRPKLSRSRPTTAAATPTTFRMVEPSFFIDLHTILLGCSLEEYLEDFKSGRADTSVAIRSIAHAIPIPGEYSIALYVCSEELCQLLAATDEKRVTEIAHQWRALLWPMPQPYEPEPEKRRQNRTAILAQLVTLAQDALRSGR
jgi:hypothetical protein